MGRFVIGEQLEPGVIQEKIPPAGPGKGMDKEHFTRGKGVVQTEDHGFCTPHKNHHTHACRRRDHAASRQNEFCFLCTKQNEQDRKDPRKKCQHRAPAAGPPERNGKEQQHHTAEKNGRLFRWFDVIFRPKYRHSQYQGQQRCQIAAEGVAQLERTVQTVGRNLPEHGFAHLLIQSLFRHHFFQFVHANEHLVPSVEQGKGAAGKQCNDQFLSERRVFFQLEIDRCCKAAQSRQISQSLTHRFRRGGVHDPGQGTENGGEPEQGRCVQFPVQQ